MGVEQRYLGPGAFIPTFIGAVLAGKRKGDGLIRAGVLGAVIWALLGVLEKQLDADRRDRRAHQQEMVGVISKQTQAIEALTKAGRCP